MRVVFGPPLTPAEIEMLDDAQLVAEREGRIRACPAQRAAIQESIIAKANLAPAFASTAAATSHNHERRQAHDQQPDRGGFGAATTNEKLLNDCCEVEAPSEPLKPMYAVGDGPKIDARSMPVYVWV